MSEKNHESRHILLEFSVPLLAGIAVALIWANLDNSSYQNLLHWAPLGGHFNFHFLVNDVFMCFFFAIAAKEIVEAFLPGGDLNPVKKAINPLMGTLGGILGPVAVYFIYVHISGDSAISNGWGIPTATDIAIAWLVAKAIFGKNHPAVSFLLLLAIADDAIGLGIIAIFYPDPANPVELQWMLLVVLAMSMAYLERTFYKESKSNNYLPFLLFGAISWFGFYMAHLHPALALVPIIPFMPSAGKDEGLFAERGGKDMLNRFEHHFKTPVDIGLFAFGLANAGVVFSTFGSATWAVLLALVVGKTVGITLFSLIAEKVLGYPLPDGMERRDLVVVSMIAAIGLTVALFVAGVAFTDPSLIGSAKMGALASGFISIVALIAGRLLSVKKKN